VTHSLGWARRYDVRQPNSWTRFVTVGEGPVCGVSVSDCHNPGNWGHVFDHRLEMVFGIGTGQTERDVLMLLSTANTMPGDPPRAPVDVRCLLRTFRTHNEELVNQIDTAAAFAGKPVVVMWASEHGAKPGRLTQIAKRLGMHLEMRSGVPVYVRRLIDAYQPHIH